MILCLGLLLGYKSEPIHAFTTDPKPTKEYVVDDYDHLLDPETEGMVLGKEKFYQTHTMVKPQIVMMTVPNTNGESVTDYSNDLLAQNHTRWHFGNKKYNNGVLILFAKDHGKNEIRISTGYGVESILPDLKCNNFLKRNNHLLKSHSKTNINEGLQNVFLDVTKTLGHKYTHMTKKQAKELKLQNEHKRTVHNLKMAILIIILLVILSLPYNGNWFCLLFLVLRILYWVLIIFGDLPNLNIGSNNSGSDSGSGGLFGGGGSSD